MGVREMFHCVDSQLRDAGYITQHPQIGMKSTKNAPGLAALAIPSKAISATEMYLSSCGETAIP